MNKNQINDIEQCGITWMVHLTPGAPAYCTHTIKKSTEDELLLLLMPINECGTENGN